MPRDTYYQSTGNPTQSEHLPPQKLQIQFAHTSSEKPEDARFARVFMRNLLLVSATCLAADWLGDAFQISFPFNVLVVAVAIRGMVNLWQAASVYKPHMLLVLTPILIHFFVAPIFVRAIVVSAAAAYVGREFARHYIYLATSFPFDRTEAAKVRLEWDELTLFSSLLVAPFGAAFLFPRFAPLLLIVVVLISVLMVFAAGPINLTHQLATAW